MLFIRILNYIKGYLIITINGVFAERFINICVHRNILIWDVSRKNGGFMAKMATKDFYKVRDIARITNSKVRIKRRQGLPFLMIRYRNRWPIFFAVILFIAIVHFTSTHIMSVDVEGNQRIPTEQVLSELRDVGVSFGKRVSGLNADTIRNQMIINNDEIAWLGVNVRGSRVYVEITERIDTESVPHLTEEKCNLVASKDGVIEKLEVGQGQTMVKKGDGVREGDVLVSGIMDSAYGGFRLVHSYGEVYARTEYTAAREYRLNYIEKEYSGEEKVRFGLNLFGNKIELYPPSLRPDDNYDEQAEEYVYRGSWLGNNVEFGGVVEKFLEYKEVEKQRTIQEAVETGRKEMTEEVEKSVPKDAEIIARKTDHNIISGDVVSVTVTYECRENIAKESEIDKSLIDKNDNLDYDIEAEEDNSGGR